MTKVKILKAPNNYEESLEDKINDFVSYIEKRGGRIRDIQFTNDRYPAAMIVFAEETHE